MITLQEEGLLLGTGMIITLPVGLGLRFLDGLEGFHRRESLRVRRACGKRDKETYKNLESMGVGGCNEIKTTDNIIEGSRTGKVIVIFYSYNEFHPLVDFMYKDGEQW